MKKVKRENFRKALRCSMGDCVQVAITGEGVAVAHTKNIEGKQIHYTRDEWRAFIDGVKRGEFDC